MSNTVLDQLNHLKTYYTGKGVFGKSAGLVKAVDDVSFTIEKGEILFGLVEESGCGKTTIGQNNPASCQTDGGRSKTVWQGSVFIGSERVKERRAQRSR